MFENEDSELTFPTAEEEAASSLKDQMISLTYRLELVESNLSEKVDRKECMGMLERKVNASHLKKVTEEVYAKLREEKQKEMEAQEKNNQEQGKKIKELVKRLTKISKGGKQLPPQELYLESNETMFSLLIEEINDLKAIAKTTQKQIETKNKKTVLLNNEVCLKMEKMEQDIQATMQFMGNLRESIISDRKNTKRADLQQASISTNHTNPNEAYENLRFEIFSKNLETLQRELSSKMNIKDIMPLLRQNLLDVEEDLKSLKVYVEQGIESTRKILMHQSQINQEICTTVKLGCWQSFQTELGYSIWNRQLYNMHPEGFTWYKNCREVTIPSQGLYIVKIYSLNQSKDNAFKVKVNEEAVAVQGQQIVRIIELSELKVQNPHEHELVMFLQKL